MLKYRLGTEVTNSIRIILNDRGLLEVDNNVVNDTIDFEYRTYRFNKEIYNNSKLNYIKINHFPNTSDITQKDKLIRHLRRLSLIYGNIYNFIPNSYILPRERNLFETYYNNNTKKIWICKPSCSSQGRGIFLINNISELTTDEPYVIQEYIERPYLIGGYKFDIRLYVLVTSFRPLEVFIYRRGIARFGTQKYQDAPLNNLYAHLTNASINKHSDTFTNEKNIIGAGSKWTLNRLFEHLEENGIKTNKLWSKIKAIVILSLLSIVQNVPINQGCHELFGYDILLDENGRPHLLEVNCSPAMAIQGDVDRATKVFLMNDICEIVGLTGSNIEQPKNIKRAAPLPNVKTNSNQLEINKRLYQGYSSQTLSTDNKEKDRSTASSPTNTPKKLGANSARPSGSTTSGLPTNRLNTDRTGFVARNPQNSNSSMISLIANRKKIPTLPRRISADIENSYKNACFMDATDDDVDEFYDLSPWIEEKSDDESDQFSVNLASGYNSDNHDLDAEESAGVDGDVNKNNKRLINDGEDSDSEDDKTNPSSPNSKKKIGRYRERALKAERKPKIGGAIKFSTDTQTFPPGSTILNCHIESSRAHGDFEKIFPFNDATENAADSLYTTSKKDLPANVFQEFQHITVKEVRNEYLNGATSFS